MSTTLDFSYLIKQGNLSPLFWALYNTRKRYVINYGGSASGKSYAQHQLELINLLMNPKGDTMVARKHGTTIKDSCYKLFNTIAYDWGIHELFTWKYYQDERRIICNHNQRQIAFKGLDDVEKIKSISGMQRLVVEEANQMRRDDFTELQRRFRGIEDIQMFFLLNPVSEEHWIKTDIIDGGIFKEDLAIFKTTFNNNKFLTEADKRYFEQLKELDPEQYNIYAEGNWGRISKHRKFAYGFNKLKQVKPLTVHPQLPVYLSFDFNVEPFVCTAWQHYGNDFIHGVGEVHINMAKNKQAYGIGEMCALINAKFPNNTLYVTGDATELTKRNLINGFSLYQSVAKELRLQRHQLNVPSVNPSVAGTRELLNAMLLNHPNFYIDPSMELTIKDLMYVEVDDRGDIIKDRSSETRKADFLDSCRYYSARYHSQFIKRR